MTKTAELQHSNGSGPAPADEFSELGSLGLEAYSGYITEAYNTKLHWPTVEPLYSRIWRSDPEVTIVRQLFSALSGQLDITWQLPERVGGRELGPPNDADKRSLDFAFEVLEDIDGGIEQWLTSCNTRAPFYGYALWEELLGVRREGWQAPDDDPWRSQYNDGLVGVRRLAWRDYSSFDSWELDDASGRLSGWWQQDFPNSRVMIPLDRLIHIKYGDMDNPEGLATLEALWRLERMLYGLEIIQSIGYEHTAGHLSVTVEEGDFNAGAIKAAARAIMSAQEGNYAAWPKGTSGDIIDSAFSAAMALETSIQNRRVLKLTLFGMQFIALGAMTNSGSYALGSDSSAMAMLIFNSIVAGNVKQLDQQFGKRLFEHPTNAAAFAGMTRRPQLTVNAIEKKTDLLELSQFTQAMATIMPFADDDIISIRKAGGILPETLPEKEGEAAVALPSASAVSVSTGEDTPDNIAASVTLNGTQIDAAMRVTLGLTSGTTPRFSAIEFLVAVGLGREIAIQMVDDHLANALSPEEKEPKKEPPQEPETGELAQGDGEKFKPRGKAIVLDTDVVITAADLDRAVVSWREYVGENEPALASLLDAEVVEDEA